MTNHIFNENTDSLKLFWLFYNVKQIKDEYKNKLILWLEQRLANVSNCTNNLKSTTPAEKSFKNGQKKSKKNLLESRFSTISIFWFKSSSIRLIQS
jgi:hypothetical protein